MSETFVPPLFDETGENSSPERQRGEVFSTADGETAEFVANQDFDEPVTRLKGGSLNDTIFNSSKFIEEETPLTNIEEYAERIRENADQYVTRVKNDTELVKSEVELELANALLLKSEAEEEAKRIIEEANTKKDEIFAAGKEEGFQVGRGEGLRQFKEENTKNVETLFSLVEDLKSLRTDLLQQYENQIVALSLLIAQKVTHEHIKCEPTSVVELLKAVIQQFEGQGNIRIRIHPEEYLFIVDHKNEFTSFLDDDQILKIKVDDTVNPASAIIESDFSVVDLDLSKQFEEMQLKLRNCAEDRRSLFLK